MTALSRADLLRVLNIQKEHKINWDNSELATLFQFDYAPDKIDPSDKTKYELSLINNNQTATLYSTQPQQKYWYIAKCQRVEEDENREEITFPSLPEMENNTWQPIKPFAHQPLLKAGQWQNIWDYYLTSTKRGKSIDVPRAVHCIASGQPIKQLPKLSHLQWNQSVVLIIDRSKPLRPVWSDMREAWLSLLALMGDEQLQTYFLPNGATGDWSVPGTAVTGSTDDLAPEATVVMIGAFGALTTANISPDWLMLIDTLKQRGHSLFMLPVCPINHLKVNAHSLDPRPQQQLDKLLIALALAWKPGLSQLRALRFALPNATLVDELYAYNHSDIEQQGMNINLNPELLLENLQLLENLAEAKKLRHCADSWLDSLSITAREIEQLQRELHKSPQLKDYQQLQVLAQRTLNGMQTDTVGMASSLMRSMLPITHLLEQSHWLPFLQVAQKVALAAGNPLPLQHQGLNSHHQIGVLRQLNQDLVIDQNSKIGLLTLGDQAYCVQTRRRVRDKLPSNVSELEIIDQGHAWELKAISQPDWANRIWQEAQGIFATHNDNAIFHLQPASAENPTFQWVCQHNPWSWASESGIDEKGLWAALQVNNVKYRLRWIKPGQFMMGSPEDEKNRNNDETQHLVTLTQGYWLGETSCTQAFWLAVMGKNPSHFKNNLQLPVERISWNDCQLFLSRLSALFPDFIAQLPTEAQWEYACRAGTSTAYWCGDNLDKDYANYESEQTESETKYLANNFGLKSMSGNVKEWCSDRLGRYSATEVIDPRGAKTGQYRVLRGGCWIRNGRSLRAARRSAIEPDYCYRNIGFRLAGGWDPQASKQDDSANRGPWNGQASGKVEQE